MALVKFGGGVIQMTGSIAGDTFARNRFGNYVRARTKPTNPKTDRQNDVRAAVAELSDRWAHTLTPDQRTSWNTYADRVNMLNRLSEVVHLSGYNHFIRSNACMARGGLTIADDGPTIFDLPAHDPGYAIEIISNYTQVRTTFDNTMDWAKEAGAFMFLSHGAPQNGQRNFFAGPWRIIGVVAGCADPLPESPAIHMLGWPSAVGQHNWCFARIRHVDGRLSTPFRADCFPIPL